MDRELDYSEECYNFKNAKGFENIPTGAIYFGTKTLGLGTHGYELIIPDEQEIFFDEKGNLKQEYKDKKYPKPEKYGDKWGWTVGGHNINGNLEVIFNQEQDKKYLKKYCQKILLMGKAL